MKQNLQYRPEIDGLRAIAILPVLLFHAGFSWMSGGFLGVDLFFVISGFLITTILLRDLQNGTFSIARFYERRARRILPALTVVFVATLALAPLFAWHWQIKEISLSGFFSAIFFSNYFFLDQVDYFRTDAETYPFLHMWSLSIEEQYYIAFPLLLWVIWKLGGQLRAALLLIAGLSAASLLLASNAAPLHPEHTFYLIQYRAFELGIGSLAAVLALRHGRIPAKHSLWLAPLAIAVICASMLLVPDHAVDPWSKLPLLIATAVLLLSTIHSGPAYRLLTLPAMKLVGLISFSLYLWHQPILAYARMSQGHELSPHFAAALIALTFALSWLTYRFIETPFRKAKASTSQVLRYAAATLAVLSLGAVMLFQKSESFTPEKPLDLQLSISPEVRGNALWTDYLPLKDKKFSTGKERVLIIGDSHSQDFLMASLEAGAFAGTELATIYIPRVCQPYFGPEDVKHLQEPGYEARCGIERQKMPQYIDTISTADTVILISSWDLWAAKRINQTVSFIEQRGPKVVVIGAKAFSPEGKPPHLRSYKGLNAERRAEIRGIIPGKRLEVEMALQERQGDFTFISLFDLLCISPADCSIFTKEGSIISYDGSHLTREGAKYVGNLLFNHPALSRYSRPDNHSGSEK